MVRVAWMKLYLSNENMKSGKIVRNTDPWWVCMPAWFTAQNHTHNVLPPLWVLLPRLLIP